MISLRIFGAYRTALLVCMLFTKPLAANTFIATPANFDSVFAAAGGGDTIAMVGTFGEVRMRNRTFVQKITLNASQAVFTQQVVLDNINYMAVLGGTFNIASNGDYAKAAAVWGGANIYFKDVKVNGAVKQFGISFRGTHNAQVSNSRFTGLSVGVGFGSVTAGYAGGNLFTGSFSDGIDISDSHGVTASRNTCSSGNPSPGAHPDCIQMWSVAGRPLNSDHVIINNSAYGLTQGFTSFSDGGGGLRLTISNNTVNTLFPQGVACYDCINSTITNNKISTMQGAAYQTGLSIFGGSGNTVAGNVVTPYLKPRITNGDLTTRSSSPISLNSLQPGPTNSLEDVTLDRELSSNVAETPSAVPEPSSWTLLICGFAAVGIARRRTTGSSAIDDIIGQVSSTIRPDKS